MIKTKAIKRQISYKRNPKRLSQTVPDQSMDIKELVRRYVKGIPIDVTQREKVFIDQSELDLERLGRMDSADKAFMASEMRYSNEALLERIQSSVRARKEANEAEQARKAEEKEERKKDTGIDSLDNTMPVDTELDSRQLRGQKKQRSN